MSISHRSRWRRCLVLVALALVSPACSDLEGGVDEVAVPDGGKVTIPTEPQDVEARILVAFDLSGSGEEERTQYLTWLATEIAPAAAAAQASVTVYGIRESTSDYRELGAETFAFDSDNPVVIEDETTRSAQRLVDEVSGVAGSLETTGTNITAALRQAGDIIDGGQDVPTTLYFLSDGVSSSPAPCDLWTLYATAPGPDPATVAGDCIGSDPIDLHGATVHVFGAASSLGGGLGEELVGISEAVFWELVSRAGGERGQWTPSP